MDTPGERRARSRCLAANARFSSETRTRVATFLSLAAALAGCDDPVPTGESAALSLTTVADEAAVPGALVTRSAADFASVLRRIGNENEAIEGTIEALLRDPAVDYLTPNRKWPVELLGRSEGGPTAGAGAATPRTSPAPRAGDSLGSAITFHRVDSAWTHTKGRGHGTATSGIVGMDEVRIEDDDFLAGVQWAIDNGLDVLSMSFGADTFGLSVRDKLSQAYDSHDMRLLAAAPRMAGDDRIPAAWSFVAGIGSVAESGASTDLNDPAKELSGKGGTTTLFADCAPVSQGASLLCLGKPEQLYTTFGGDRPLRPDDGVQPLGDDQLGSQRRWPRAGMNASAVSPARYGDRFMANLVLSPSPFTPERGIGWQQLTGTPVCGPRATTERPLEVRGGEIVDRETGSVWAADGEAVSGPLADEGLEVLTDAVVAFWYAWAWFHPRTEVWTGG